MIVIEELIKYFEKELAFKPTDLIMSAEDRSYKLGQLEMLAEIEVLNKEGFPDEQRDSKPTK